jgi:hypothetical protein
MLGLEAGRTDVTVVEMVSIPRSFFRIFKINVVNCRYTNGHHLRERERERERERSVY